MKTGVCTIVAKNYLPHARVLMSSLAKWNPELQRFVILVDAVDGYFDPEQEDFIVISSSEVPVPQSKWFHFKYNVLELSTAIKPYALEMLLDQYGLDRIIYFDPDIKIYRPLDLLLDALQDSDIVLTPHLTEPIADKKRPSELDILRAGSYNLGFIALADSSNVRSLLRWWQGNLFDDCVIDVEKGLFVDQRWVDLVPGLFENVLILRHPGFNVAYWNVHGRAVERRNATIKVNGRPLYFFHFSGFNPEKWKDFSKHQDRFQTADLGQAKALVRSYRDDLLQHGYEQCKEWPYAYGFFVDATPIPDMARPVHHANAGLPSRIEDPFSQEGLEAFVETWNEPIRGPNGVRELTRLAHEIYMRRPDVRAAMPDVFGAHWAQYLKWLLSSNAREHRLPEVLIRPVKEALLREFQRRSSEFVPPARGEDWDQAGAPLNGHGRYRLRLTTLTKLIYESRPDLQAAFPDPCGRDSLSYLTWLFSYGRYEYQLDSRVLDPFRQDWSRLLADVSRFRAWRHRARVFSLTASACVRAQRNTDFPSELFGGALAASLDSLGPQATTATENAGVSPMKPRKPLMTCGGPPGINAVGYVNAEMGVGEVVRMTIRAARAAGLGASVRGVSTNGIYRENDRRIQEDAEHIYPTNVIHINADQVPGTLPGLGDELLTGRHNIGYWCWEVEEFPDCFCPSFQYFDEIWTLSTFSQDSIARKSPVPVVRIPPAIEIKNPPERGRSYFGLPEDSFLFVTAFDMRSIFERKNPLGVVRAFMEAFGGDPSNRLIVKVSNGQSNPEAMRRLSEACQGHPITVIDKMLDREDVYALFNVCDCLVSLHRSEGFGLTVAEAMYLGKPVVVTGYSGNMDFTAPSNAFLVGYRLTSVPQDCDPYPSTAQWAEPSISDAVEQLRTVRSSGEKRGEVARAGQAAVQNRLSPLAVGRQIRERLGALNVGEESSPQGSGAKTTAASPSGRQPETPFT